MVGQESTVSAAPEDVPCDLAPRGPVDLRGRPGEPLRLTYRTDAVVVVGGLPGSGKSTLIRRWEPAVRADVVDPRRTRLACQAVMPSWLPYAVYRPWTRTLHLLRTRAAFRRPGPLLVHDCASRWWMRRLLARWARRRHRELHLVLLAVHRDDALAGQRARNRTTGSRVFRRHVRGLTRLTDALDRRGAAALPGATSVLLADAASRERLTSVAFLTPAHLPHQLRDAALPPADCPA